MPAPVDGGLVELTLGNVAHGGHCVARTAEGRVVFVRHGLPGEQVMVHVTDAPAGGSFWRGDVVEVITASPDRVPSVWPVAGAGGVGGAELAHVALPAQRRWKATVVAEQLARLATINRDVTVEAAPGDDEAGGLGYRTRIELTADESGRAGMLGHRSHEVVPIESMPLATAEIAELGLLDQRWTGGSRIQVAAPSGGDAPVVTLDGLPARRQGGRWRPDPREQARTTVTERFAVGGTEYTYRVAGSGFWQVHRAAPGVLVEAVTNAVGDVTGQTVLDLYSGAGLFTVPLADAVGPTGVVVAVEGDARAVRDARRNLHEQPWVELLTGDVQRLVTDDEVLPGAVDTVVLDPPRSGAGRKVIDGIVARRPRQIVYVACDPAALARDVATLGELGWSLDSLRAFDLFPMTHHVECVAVLTTDG